MNTKKSFYSALILSPVLLLSGCNWFSSEKTADTAKSLNTNVASGEWIVKMDDDVIVTSDQFKKEFDALLAEKPQLKAMLPLMPNLEPDFAKGLGNQQVVSRYIKDNKIDQKADYAAKKERYFRAAEQMLNAEFFAEAFPTKELSDADAKQFYEENKDSLQGALISRGGVVASGISFDNKADADAFFNKIKNMKKLDLEKVAQDNKLGEKFEDFNMVNEQSFNVEPVLKAKILAIKEFPKVQMLPIADKKFWVVYAAEKQDSQYRPFEQVKDGVKNVAKQTEQVKRIQGELDKLMKKYNVQINEDYFREKVSRANAEAAAIRALQERKQAAAQNDAESQSQPLPAAKSV